MREFYTIMAFNLVNPLQIIQKTFIASTETLQAKIHPLMPERSQGQTISQGSGKGCCIKIQKSLWNRINAAWIKGMTP